MKKLTDFLEKHVQWVAIALGGAWLLYMVYSFVLTNTAWQIDVTNADGQTEHKSPGEVDESVAQIAQKLKDKIDHGTPVKIPVPNFEGAVDLKPKKMAEYAIAWANSPTQDVTPPPSATGTPAVANGNPNAVAPANAQKIVELPKAPPATDLATAVGRSSAIIPPPPQPVVLNADPNNPQPPPQQPAQGVAAPSDIDWITVSFKISMTDLAREFQRTQMPQGPQGTTSMLEVQLLRQERISDGEWGPPTVCEKLTTATLPPCPDEKAGKAAAQGYLNLAVAALPEIIQPKFYDIAKGDPWTLPKALVGNGIVGANGAPMILGPNDTREGFDPTQYINPDPKAAAAAMAAANPPLTNREKQLIQKAKSEAASKAAAEKSKSRAPSGPARGGGGGFGPRGNPGGGRGGDIAGAAEDGYRPAGRMPGGRPPNADETEGYNPGAQQQQGNFAQMFPLPPQPDFDPRVIVTNNAANAGGPAAGNLTTLVGWAHDAKPEPGKTYRYMIRYKIKNPIFSTQGFAKEKAMADKFAIVSQDSGWTEPVQAPPIVQFFFANASAGSGKSTVEVYRHQDGALHKERFNVFPGDAIGLEKNGVDYATHFTLVDLRPELRGDHVTAWLITPEGILVKRDVKSDSESPQKSELDKQIQAANATNAAANAGGGGGAGATP